MAIPHFRAALSVSVRRLALTTAMATDTALSTSLPYLSPHCATSFLFAAASVSLPVPSRTVRLQETRFAAAAPVASGVLESTNGAIPTAVKGGAGRAYGREYFPWLLSSGRSKGAPAPSASNAK